MLLSQPWLWLLRGCWLRLLLLLLLCRRRRWLLLWLCSCFLLLRLLLLACVCCVYCLLGQVCVDMECVQEGLVVVLVGQHAAKEGAELPACRRVWAGKQAGSEWVMG